eukprot:gene11923-12067_t
MVSLTEPAVLDARRYAAYLKLAGYKTIPPQVPLSYLFVESFRLTMLAMAHPDFPFNLQSSFPLTCPAVGVELLADVSEGRGDRAQHIQLALHYQTPN